VFDALVAELAAVIRALVQPHNERDVLLLEVGHIVIWPQRVVAAGTGVLLRVRSREGHKAPLHIPVQVSIFNLLVELVFFDVELGEVEEFALARLVETAQCVEDGEVEGTCDGGGIVLSSKTKDMEWG
jgi:hypothetical protein